MDIKKHDNHTEKDQRNAYWITFRKKNKQLNLNLKKNP